MKIRTGFISNSSSSSFVLIIPTKDFENEITETEISKHFMFCLCNALKFKH